MDPQILTFAGVALLLTITPGPDTVLVIRNASHGGRSAGTMTSIGICCGLLVHAAFAAAGISVILLKSANAFAVVKTLGAAYLIYLAWQSLRRVASEPSLGEVLSTGAARERRAWQWFGEGFVSNLLNPKVAFFYLALLPQFIKAGDPVIDKSFLLAAIHLGISLVWLLGLVAAVGTLRGVLARRRVRQWLDGLSGVVLLGFGLRLAFESVQDG